ncbi:MAG TPA: hypothetical protein PLI87_06190 [bacterium]|nr:hypothetical protein [bacterium]
MKKMKVPEHRRFNYQFRYYKPETEERPRIHFERLLKSEPPKRVSALRTIMMLVIIIIIVVLLLRKGSNFLEPTQDNVILEEIQVVE